MAGTDTGAVARRIVPLSAAQRRRNRQGDLVTTWLLAGIWFFGIGVRIIGRALNTNIDAWGEVIIVIVTVAAIGVLVRWPADLVAAGVWRLAVMLLPVVYVMVRNLYSGVLDFHGISVIVLTLAIAAARPRASVLRVLAGLMILSGVAAVLLGLLRPDLGVKHALDGQLTVRADKEVFPGLGLLIGFQSEENVMGQIMALGLPLLALIENRWVRYPGMAVMVFALLWSSARGGLAVAVAVAALAVVLPRVDAGSRGRLLRRSIQWCSLVASLAICAALPWILRPETDGFTGRGGIWRDSTFAWWSQDRLFGLGSDWFTNRTLESSSPIIAAATTGHNEMVHLGVTGGLALIGLAVLQAAGFLAWTTRAGARYGLLATQMIVSVWISGWLEYSFGYVDDILVWPVTFPILAVLMFCRDGARAGRPPRVPAARFRRA